MTYGWPGNVRELQNVIERAVITSDKGRLDCMHLVPAAGPRPAAEAAPPSEPSGKPFLTVEQMLQMERENLVRALEASGWRVSGKGGAAELLGMPPSTLNSRMKALGIRRPR
jgi:transcriptional regulator with GAF, ATPase, and Fis domain